MSKNLRLKLLGVFAFMLAFGLLGIQGYSQTPVPEPLVTSFTIDGQVGNAVIDPVAHTISLKVPCGGLIDLCAISDQGVTTWYSVSASYAMLFWGDISTNEPADVQYGMVPAWKSTLGLDMNPGSGDPLDYCFANPETEDPTVEVQAYVSLKYYTDGQDVVDLVNIPDDRLIATVLWTVSITEVPCSTDVELTGLSVRGPDCLGELQNIERTKISDRGWTLTLKEGTDEDVPLRFGFTIPEGATSDPESVAWMSFNQAAPTQEIVVTAEDGVTTATYTFTAVFYPASTAKELTAFKFTLEGNDYNGTVVGDPEYTVSVEVPHDTDVTALVGIFELEDLLAMMTHSEDNPVIQVSGVTPNDYSEPVAFTVHDEACGTVEYFVTVTLAEECCNDIESLSITGTSNPCDDDGKGSGCDDIVDVLDFVIDPVAKTAIVEVPWGMNLGDVVIDGVLSAGATCDDLPMTSIVAGVPTPITIFAANGIDWEIWTITVTKGDPHAGTELLTFGFLAADNPGVLSEDVVGEFFSNVDANRIDLYVPFGTPVDALVASWTSSPYSCVYVNGPLLTDFAKQCSGITPNDWTAGQVTYMVRAESDGIESLKEGQIEIDGPSNEEYYSIWVMFGKPSDDDRLLNLDITGELMNCVDLPLAVDFVQIDEFNWEIYLPDNLTSANFGVTFEIPGLDAIATPPSPLALTLADFVSGDVVISVQAQNPEMDPAIYTIHPVFHTPSSVKKLLTYSVWLMGIEYTADVNEDAKTVEFTVPYGSVDLYNMIFNADFTLADEKAILTHSEDPQEVQTSAVLGVGGSSNDFSTPVAFTVFAEDCSTVEYFVTITEADNCCNDIGGIQLSGVFKDCYTKYLINVQFVEGSDNTWTVEVPYGTYPDFIGLTYTPEPGSEGMTVVPTITSFSDGIPMPITVTAANGISTQDYTLIVTVGAASTAHELFTFDFMADDNTALEVDVEGVVNSDSHRVDLEVPFGTDISALTACFTHSDYSCVYVNGPGLTDLTLQKTCVTANSFVGPVTYTVVSQAMGEYEDYYNVYVTFAPPDTQNWMEWGSLYGLMDCLHNESVPTVTQDGNTYAIRLRTGMDEGVDFDFSYNIPELAESDQPNPITGINFVNGVPVVITVTAQSGDVEVYTLMPEYVTPSDKKAITYFAFHIGAGNPFLANYVGEINETAKTITVRVPYSTNPSSLVATFELDDEYAWMTHSEENNDLQVPQESGVSAINYSTPAAFTVFDEACRTVEYFVTVIVEPNQGNNILSITLNGTGQDACDPEWPVGPVSFVPGADNLWTVTVPYNTNLDAFVLTGVLSTGATMSPALSAITSYTDPIAVTVTAVDGQATQDFTLTISVAAPSSAHLLTAFNFMMEDNEGLSKDVIGVVDEDTHRVDLVVPYGTDVTGLVNCFEVSPHACLYVNGPGETDFELQTSCVSDNDFTYPRHFTVKAQDGESEDTYNVVVTFEDADVDVSLTGLELVGMEDCIGYAIEPKMTEVDGVYTVRLREGMDEDTEFTVTFEIAGLSTASPASGFSTTFVDGVGVDIVVTAESGATATYTLMPNYVTPSTNKQLTYFAFAPYADGKGNMQFVQTYVGTIDEAAKTVTVHVPYSSTVDMLKATFELNDEYASMTHSEENGDLQVPQHSGLSPINYSTPAAFTVFDEECNTVEYFVTVIIDPNEGNEIISLMLDGMQYANCECGDEDVAVGTASFEGLDITLTVPYGTDLSDFVLDAVLAEGATAVPALEDITSYDGTISIVVTADDGLAVKTYTLTIVRADALTGNQLMTFGFTDEFNEGLEGGEIWGSIDELKNRVDIAVPYGTPVSTLIASFTNSPYSCVYINGEQVTDAYEQCTGVTVNDFTNYLTYTVIAQNGDEAYYNVFVEVLPPDTDQWIENFMVNNLPECFGDYTYDVAGTMDETAISVKVKAGTDVTALNVTFDIPEKATVSPAAGVYDFTSPVTFTVTAQDGTSTDYVVTVSERATSNDKKILSYAIGSSVGTINQTNKVIEVWVPWLTDVSSLVATFTLSDGAKMTHSEDSWILQNSGITPNNFTTPVAYTVWAEDCTTLEYFVIVRIIPNTNTGISQFAIEYTGCGCDLGMRIDDFAKRIYVRIPYEDADGQLISLSSLNVVTIGVASGATVSPGTGVRNFSNGPVNFTVTAPDGVTKVTWAVMVENPPCTGTDINEWQFRGDIQVSRTIDKENHQIMVTLLPGTDLTSLIADSGLDCGATICCNAGACAGNANDYSGEGNCHTCVVTAQDRSITQDWTICVRYADIEKPIVYTNSVLVMNCADSVNVWANENGGKAYIVDEGTAETINALVNAEISGSGLEWMAAWLAMNKNARTLLTDAVKAHTGASAAYPDADSIVPISSEGIYSGVYYAFVVDSAGNVSCASEEAIFVDICVKEVADLCELRAASPVYMYIVTGEVLVSYEEGNIKFVQDVNCGIKVTDDFDAWAPVLGVGKGLTNIKGTIDKSGIQMTFTPVCCYVPDVTSTGNVIPAVELTYDEFKAQCYSHNGYESMLVKIVDPMIAFDDYGLEDGEYWILDYLDLATINAKGDYDWYIQKVFNANYIGDLIPTEPTIYQGIRTNVDWGDIYALITPRSKSDIIKVTAGMLLADPNPASITGVTPGTCGSITIHIINQGVGNLTVSALYLDDAAGTDEFELIDPAQVPFTLGTWESMDVQVDFCPNDAGAESTTLLVEYGDGKVLEVPVNGETVLIVLAPYFTDFNKNDPANTAGWKATNMSYRNTTYNWGVSNQAYMYAWSWWGYSGGETTVLESPGFDLSALTNTTLTWWTGTYYSVHLRVDVSYDKTNWTTVKNFGTFTNGNGAGKYMSVDLSAYDGETIFVRWVGGGSYFGIDNVSVDAQITNPIFKASPVPGDFGGVQVGENGTVTFTVTNDGVSVLKVKKVEIISGPEFVLADGNTYPVEVVDGTYAYAYNGTSALSFDVTFSPTDIGVYTGKVLITYGLYEEKVVEIPFSGEGLSCYTAAEAFVGENWAASQNSWFTYTAEKFQIVNINSCHPNNTVDPYEYSYDTWLDVYDDCDGEIIATNDDLEWDACPYNRALSGVEFAMNAGETVKIFWPWMFSSVSDDVGFYFNIVPSYPIDGDVCETAIPLTLPVVNHFGTTVGFEDDYDMSPCSPYSNYMDGNDKVYSITLDVEGYLTGNILGAYGSIHVLDKCPVEELEKRNCKAFASGPNGGEFTKRIQPGFYYVIVSTWAPPQTVDFLLNMSFEELSTGVDDAGLGSSLVVYPNPTQGRFTVSISNAEASDLTLELVNISGQVVYRNEVKSVYSYNEEIDASAFAKGVYYLKVNDGVEVKIEKVVIQ